MERGFQGSQDSQTRCLRIHKTKDTVTVKIDKHIFKLWKKDYLEPRNLKVLKDRDNNFFKNIDLHLKRNHHHFEEANEAIFQKFILDSKVYLEATRNVCTLEEFSAMESQRILLIATITNLIQSEGIIAKGRINTEISHITGVC